MSRLSSSLVGRTPIADKIKIFDASATVKPRPAHLPPPTTPTNKELCPLLLTEITVIFMLKKKYFLIEQSGA